MELVTYSQDELFNILIGVIKENKTHKYYKEVVEHSNFCRQILTGDDQEKLLIRYNKDGEELEQAVNLTNSRTQFASGQVYTVFEEVERSDDTVTPFRFDKEGDQAEKKIKEINSLLEKFKGTDAKSWTYEAVHRLNFYDPNAFIFINFTPYNYQIEKTDFIYPVEISSEEAVMFEYSNGILIYLVFYMETEIEDEEKNTRKEITKIGRNFYLVAKDVLIEFLELPDVKAPEIKPGYEYIELEVVTSGDPIIPGKKKKKYQWQIHQTNSGEIPAVRVGYIKNPVHFNETCSFVMHRAEKLFYDLIWTKSEYDLAKALHWFYQKFVYAPACEHKDADYGPCQGGHFANGEECPVCEGSGMLIHETVQDVITLKLPRNAADIVPLSNMVHYETIDISIGKHLQEDFKGIEQDIFKAVFTSQVFDQSEIAVTATEKNLDLRAVKNALIKFADHVSKVYMFIIRMAAHYTDNSDGIIVNHKHSKDFKLETLDDKIKTRKALVDAGAPYQAIRSNDRAIIEMQFEDDPQYIAILDAREKFRPYREKTKEERMFILVRSKETDPNLILWKHFEQIMTEIAYEDKERSKPWHLLSYPEQKAIVDQKVQAIKDQVQKEQEEAQKALMNPLRSQNDPNNEGDPNNE